MPSKNAKMFCRCSLMMFNLSFYHATLIIIIYIVNFIKNIQYYSIIDLYYFYSCNNSNHHYYHYLYYHYHTRELYHTCIYDVWKSWIISVDNITFVTITIIVIVVSSSIICIIIYSFHYFLIFFSFFTSSVVAIFLNLFWNFLFGVKS